MYYCFLNGNHKLVVFYEAVQGACVDPTLQAPKKNKKKSKKKAPDEPSSVINEAATGHSNLTPEYVWDLADKVRLSVILICLYSCVHSEL